MSDLISKIISKIEEVEKQLADISNDLSSRKLLTLSEIPVIGDVVYIPNVSFDSNGNLKSASIQRKQISDIYRLRDTGKDKLELYFLLSELDTPPIGEWETPAQYGEEASVNLANWVFFFREDVALRRLHYAAGLNEKHINLACEIKRGDYCHRNGNGRLFVDLMFCSFIQQVDGLYVLTQSGKLWLETMTQGG